MSSPELKNFLTSRQAAIYCGYTYSYWRKIYHKKLGLRPCMPTGRPRFKKSDLDRVMEEAQV
jgi:putative sterol carrier protein